MDKRFLGLEQGYWWMWLGWSALMATFTAVAMDVSRAVVRDVLPAALPPVLVGAVFGAVFGTITGTVQWLVLHIFLRPLGWWVYASAVGWTLAWMSPTTSLSSTGQATRDWF